MLILVIMPLPSKVTNPSLPTPAPCSPLLPSIEWWSCLNLTASLTECTT